MLYFPCRMDWGKDPLTLSNPSADLEPKGLQDPGYPLTTHNQVKATNPHAAKFIDANDPVGDDKGAGAYAPSQDGYAYPKNPNFIPVCFDVTRLQLSPTKPMLISAFNQSTFRTRAGSGSSHKLLKLILKNHPFIHTHLVPDHDLFRVLSLLASSP